MTTEAAEQDDTPPVAPANGAGEALGLPAGAALNMVKDIPVTLSIELGRASMSIKQLLELDQGAVIELDRMVDDLGDNSLIIGRILAAHVHRSALRGDDREDNDIIRDKPLFAYLYPERFAIIDRSQGFPMPAGFKR